MKKFRTLYKRTAAGAVQQWDIAVEERAKGTAAIIVKQGLQDGKKQTYETLIKEGKNAGRKNATTAYEQAVKEAEAQWVQKRDRKHYSEDVSESEAKRAMAPMLAQPYPKHASKVDWDAAFAQPKFDGHRCLARCEGREIILSTRTGKLITSVPHIADVLCTVMQTGDVFDGELYCHGKPLMTIASWIKRKQPESENLNFHVYDLVADIAFADRLEALKRRLRDVSGHVELADTHPVLDEKQLMGYQAVCLEEGYEGAMLRWGETGYEAGQRTSALLKVKTFKDAEFKIVGVKEGRGTYNGTAIFTCETAEGYRFDVTSPGTLAQKREFWLKRRHAVGKMLTVMYPYFTSTEEPVPFQPVAKSVKD